MPLQKHHKANRESPRTDQIAIYPDAMSARRSSSEKSTGLYRRIEMQPAVRRAAFCYIYLSGSFERTETPARLS